MPADCKSAIQQATSLRYGKDRNAAPSMVSGGNYLFFGTGAQPFVTYSAVVPEPSTVSLACLGVLALARRFLGKG